MKLQKTDIPNIDLILRRYGCSISMFESLDESYYLRGTKLLCYNTQCVYTFSWFNIYKHPVYGIVIHDKKQSTIFVESARIQSISLSLHTNNHN